MVLSGDWPEKLPQEFFDNPTATIGEPLNAAQHHNLNRLFQEQFLTENVFAIRRQAIAMSAADRFEFLARWVLPGAEHPGFRMAGDLTQTQPAPSAFDPSLDHPERGGEIVSPLFDWLDVAKELGKLAECRARVQAAVVPDHEFQQRARSALLLLLNLEQGDQQAASGRTSGCCWTYLKGQANGNDRERSMAGDSGGRCASVLPRRFAKK